MNITFDDDDDKELTIAIAERNWLRMQRKYKQVMDEMERNRKQKEGEK